MTTSRILKAAKIVGQAGIVTTLLADPYTTSSVRQQLDTVENKYGEDPGFKKFSHSDLTDSYPMLSGGVCLGAASVDSIDPKDKELIAEKQMEYQNNLMAFDTPDSFAKKHPTLCGHSGFPSQTAVAATMAKELGNTGDLVNFQPGYRTNDNTTEYVKNAVGQLQPEETASLFIVSNSGPGTGHITRVNFKGESGKAADPNIGTYEGPADKVLQFHQELREAYVEQPTFLGKYIFGGKPNGLFEVAVTKQTTTDSDKTPSMKP